MKDVQYRYRVKQIVEVDVWAPNEEGALGRSARLIFRGPRWWSRRATVEGVGEFVVTRLPGAR